MKIFNIIPEGWNDEIEQLSEIDIQECMKNNTTLQGVVNECDNQYNLHVNLGNGISGIIPRSEVEAINIQEDGLAKTNLCTGKVNKFIQFKIDSINENNQPILSRKKVQEESLNWIKKDLQIGQKVSGIVKNIQPYGAFIEIGGGVVGLVHIEDLSVARIKSPYERIKIGQKLDIVVKSINREDGKVILSYKELLGSWKENAQEFTQGTKVKGIVRETEKNKNGIFVELKPNLVGMAEYKDNLQYGEEVEVYIKKIDYDKKKVKLIIV